MSRPYAAFDIDGTLIRWQLYHAIGDQLARVGLIDKDEFAEVKLARLSWKKRATSNSYKDYENSLIKVFEDSLKGLSVDDLTEVAKTVFNIYKEQVYTYTRGLINELKSNNYILFAISGSPEIIVKMMAEFYGFDDFAATAYPSKDGMFIGTKELVLGNKNLQLEKLKAKYDTVELNSIAVGDSEGDIQLLEKVQLPIAFNPTKELLIHAQKKGWVVVVERKNVIYRLSKTNGKYELLT
jgi:HAD superfamily hydrolase (TIGR01490 family)